MRRGKARVVFLYVVTRVNKDHMVRASVLKQNIVTNIAFLAYRKLPISDD